MDQMYFAIFNLNFPKIYQLTRGKWTKLYHIMCLTSTLGWRILLTVKLISRWESETKFYLSQPPDFVFFLCNMVCLLSSSGLISYNPSLAIIDVWEISVTSTIFNMPETHSCTVLCSRLKYSSFIKLVVFKTTVSGLTLWCDLLIISSCLKTETEGAEINKCTAVFEMYLEKPSMAEEDVSTVVIDDSSSDI